MFQSELLVLLLALLSCDHVLSSKENHDQGFNGKRETKNPSSRRKHIGYKCLPQRCYVVCPIEIMQPYQPGQPVPLSPGLVQPPANSPQTPVSIPPGVPPSAAAPSTEASTAGVLTSPPPSRISAKPNFENQTGPILSVANGINQALPALSTILANNTRHSDRHHLKHRKHHVHFKKLVLANRNGKKTYKFRQVSPSCFVTCQNQEFIGQSEIHQDPGINYSQQEPAEGADNEVDESDDDEPYVEGEDTPIEVTRVPASPVRSVDFIGLDDFGPDGFPAREEWVDGAEDKKKKTSKKQ